ncbi:Tetratricopeptide repeat protein [compost metagenome]
MPLIVLRNLDVDNNGVYLPDCLNELNLERECEDAMKNAEIEINLNMAVINEMLGDHYFDKEDYSKSLGFYKEALGLFGASINPSLFLNIGKCYYMLGKNQKAEDYLFLANNMSGCDILKGNEHFFSFLMSRTQTA